MNNEIIEIVKNFNSTPFLFIGSGLSMRYLGLPKWNELLTIFAKRINNDDFSYNSYENDAKTFDLKAGLLPKIAELIELDFNKKWFKEPSFRQLDTDYLSYVKAGTSPFKAEIAMYIKNNSHIIDSYKNEIEKLSEISKKSLSGIITTNYDCFIENTMDNYTTYIGQQQLLFSSTQGLAEIYKIHGCITNPNTIIINEEDYVDFDDNSSYLAAKLMTIFVEYPIIFIGYSINDRNVQKILKSIIKCMSNDNIKKLQDNFIFIEYEKDYTGFKVSPQTFIFDDKIINMTNIRLSDFELLYDALTIKKSKIPVKLMRLFKEELYYYTLTGIPTSNLRVANIENTLAKDEDLVIAIVKPSDIAGLKGLAGLTIDEWYTDIILNNINYSADEILQTAYEPLIIRSTILPLNKYLSNATKEFSKCINKIKDFNFNNIMSKSIRDNRYKKGIKNRNVKSIWSEYPQNKALLLIAHLTETEIDVDDLENILKIIFNHNPKIFDTLEQCDKSNLRRIIRIYDYLKYYNKAKELWL